MKMSLAASTALVAIPAVCKVSKPEIIVSSSSASPSASPSASISTSPSVSPSEPKQESSSNYWIQTYSGATIYGDDYDLPLGIRSGMRTKVINGVNADDCEPGIALAVSDGRWFRCCSQDELDRMIKFIE